MQQTRFKCEYSTQTTVSLPWAQRENIRSVVQAACLHSECQVRCTSYFDWLSRILCNNPTSALKYVNTNFIHTATLLHVSALKGASSGSTDTFREQGQQNARPGISIRLKSSVLYVSW